MISCKWCAGVKFNPHIEAFVLNETIKGSSPSPTNFAACLPPLPQPTFLPDSCKIKATRANKFCIAHKHILT